MKEVDRFTAIDFFRYSSGGEGETRTPAPVTRPTPLAGAPRHQLEYFSVYTKQQVVTGCLADEVLVPNEEKSGGEEGIRTLGS